MVTVFTIEILKTCMYPSRPFILRIHCNGYVRNRPVLPSYCLAASKVVYWYNVYVTVYVMIWQVIEPTASATRSGGATSELLM